MTTTIESRPAVHSTFRIEREYAATPARVLGAFADMEAKRRWFVEGEGWKVFEYASDFRVGGREHSRFAFGDGPTLENETFFFDIVPDARLVFGYRTSVPAGPLSASLVTIEALAARQGHAAGGRDRAGYLSRRLGRRHDARGRLARVARGAGARGRGSVILDG